MLKLVHNPERKKEDAHIIVPKEMSHEDRQRLHGLAQVFYGHATPDRLTYIFTQVRGNKCWLLFRHGFAAIPGRQDKHNLYCITHPKDRKAKTYHVSDAINCCKLMEPEPVAPVLVEAVKAMNEQPAVHEEVV